MLFLQGNHNKIKCHNMMIKLLKNIALLIFKKKLINKTKLLLNIKIAWKSIHLGLSKIQLIINRKILAIKVSLMTEKVAQNHLEVSVQTNFWMHHQ